MNLGVLGAGKTKFHIVLPAMMNRLGVILYSITFLIGGGLFHDSIPATKTLL